MAITTNVFSDPAVKPIVFTETYVADATFLENDVPISFSVSSSPMPARLADLFLYEAGKFLVPQGWQTACTSWPMAHDKSIGFFASTSDLTTAEFTMVVSAPEVYTVAKAYSLAQIKTPSTSVIASASFYLDSSTTAFSAVSGAYPSARITLVFTPSLLGNSITYPLTTHVLSNGETVALNAIQENTYGIVDVLATMDFVWFSDIGRTSPVAGPSVAFSPKWGIRIYTMKAGIFSERLATYDDNDSFACLGLFPSASLTDSGIPLLSAKYWATSSDWDGIALGQESNIVILANGQAQQDGSPTTIYRLDNPIPDIFSSSSSSTSSENSSLSTDSSSTKETYSSSSHSSSSVSSASSSSISSVSSSSESSVSSVSSSSIVTMSTSSSINESTSSEEMLTGTNLIANYKFDSGVNEYGRYTDSSANTNDLYTAMSIGSRPVWGATSGILDSGALVFNASTSFSQYVFTDSNIATDWDVASGTISIWIKPEASPVLEIIPIAISNGFVSTKTEIACYLNQTTNKLGWTATIDGTQVWKIETSFTYASNCGIWTNVVITHSGTRPRLYINGTDVGAITGTDTSVWLEDLFLATNSADRMLIGGAPRAYSPMIVSGFNGAIDEIRIWDLRLSASLIQLYYTTGSEDRSSSSS